MAIEEINIGSSPNSRDGDSLRGSFQKVNDNFAFVDEMLTSSIDAIDGILDKITTVPLSSIGVEGDVQHQIAVDDNYFYYCIATYVDDSTSIWKRIAWGTGGW